MTKIPRDSYLISSEIDSTRGLGIDGFELECLIRRHPEYIKAILAESIIFKKISEVKGKHTR